ncbi:MAG: hypothetical protein A2651_00955 [Candidatus Yanofskybacteria bacterium RIFCSPHIGHO2_01_FULL_42_12]|uniref:Ribosomal RNA small subunit methyltransferase E n=1 Tax=Candidatus Yanofskybacteria bacterium RIFCSPLOWO2_01_FULL_42_49 TaxID=1802694 RepID=A0A1F8GDX3_9BACT|nr:MAG: hypothetical protein A2651_00955 [Candidatus Yanofskybacteria bacterium RIFCSPHIGHO2_01_FULL_42_12]OGN23582.1 MAG: hypothetical protein A2918_00725 [Candidatus Yanofskybacteria bacterium RIFCSPLOWO2_01_FULL_42_49]
MVKKIHRFITDFTNNAGIVMVADQSVIHQINRVLKLHPGEQVIIGKGDGLEILAKIVKTRKEAIYFEPQQNVKNENEPVRRVTLYCSILKKENFETAAQKATEVGVFKMVPIISQRTVKTDIKPERLKNIIKEASEQSGRGIVPELGEILVLEEALNIAKENNAAIFLEPSGTDFLQLGKKIKTVSVFIGPEGGWTDEEISMAKKAGFKVVSLWPLIMKAETVVAVASYLVIHSPID